MIQRRQADQAFSMIWALPRRLRSQRSAGRPWRAWPRRQAAVDRVLAEGVGAVAVLVVQRLAEDAQRPCSSACGSCAAGRGRGAALGVEADHGQQPAGGVDPLDRVLRDADPDRLHAELGQGLEAGLRARRPTPAPSRRAAGSGGGRRRARGPARPGAQPARGPGSAPAGSSGRWCRAPRPRSRRSRSPGPACRCPGRTRSAV
jgi:hypothetical protein